MKKTILEMVNALGFEQEEARRMIMAGEVLVNEEVVFIPSTKIDDKSKIRMKNKKEYVSRGAYKLLKAIEYFNINIKDKVVLDIGASTGGFTQVSLINGAKKVYALDVGTNQLDYSLRIDKRVVALDKTNLKTITENMFDEKIDFVVVDVSFISLKWVFRVLKNFSYSLEVVVLIKPQFEASCKIIQDGGFVDKKHHDDIITKTFDHAKDNGFEIVNTVASPITGNISKNIEYLALFRKG